MSSINSGVAETSEVAYISPTHGAGANIEGTEERMRLSSSQSQQNSQHQSWRPPLTCERMPEW